MTDGRVYSIMSVADDAIWTRTFGPPSSIFRPNLKRPVCAGTGMAMINGGLLKTQEESPMTTLSALPVPVNLSSEGGDGWVDWMDWME